MFFLLENVVQIVYTICPRKINLKSQELVYYTMILVEVLKVSRHRSIIHHFEANISVLAIFLVIL